MEVGLLFKWEAGLLLNRQAACDSALGDASLQVELPLSRISRWARRIQICNAVISGLSDIEHLSR
jgi:hypothetical protein